MDMITQLNLGSAAELGITVMLVFAITQAVKMTRVDNRFMPWVAMGVGVIAGLVSVATTGDANYAQAAVMGLLVGGFTSGLFDGFKGIGG